MSWRRRLRIWLAAASLTLAIAPGMALAGQAQGGQGDGGGAPSKSSKGQVGELPFTGVDLLIMTGVALVLTGSGLALRRLSMPRGPVPDRPRKGWRR